MLSESETVNTQRSVSKSLPLFLCTSDDVLPTTVRRKYPSYS